MQRPPMQRNFVFRFKIALLAAFVLFTLMGLAAPNMKVLLIGVVALGASLVIAITNFVIASHRADRELNSSF